MKRGQVGFEIMIAIGVLTLIFIALSKMSIDKKTEFKNLEEALDRRDTCLKVSNLITSTYSAGDGTITNMSTKYVVSIYSDGIITIGDSLNKSRLELGYYCCYGNECQLLGSALQTNFDVDEYVTNACGDRDIFGSLLNNISKYDLIFFENPQLNAKSLTVDEIALLNNYVSSGKFIMMSEHIKQDDLFGLNLQSDMRTVGGSLAIVQAIDSRYPNLFIGQEIDFTEKVGIEIDGYKSEDVNNFEVIANFEDRPEVAAITNWKYGNGDVSYFSDFDECQPGPDDDLSCLEFNLSDMVVDHIRRSIGMLINANKTSSCTYPVGGGIISGGKFTGLIEFRNINNKVEVTTRS